MSSATESLESLSNRSWCQHKKSCSSSRWTGKNIFFMVLGFIFFWPIGLVLLFWILSGRDVKDLPHTIKHKFKALKANCKEKNMSANTDTENAVFNEYQQTQYDRIREIKEEIKDRAKRFQEFRADAQRRADQKEFEDFMAHNPSKEG